MNGLLFQRAAFAVLLCSVVAAEGWAADRTFHFKVGYDVGGDTLATVIYADGDTDRIKANEGFFFGAGVSLLNDAKSIEAEISLAAKFGGSVASNGDVTFMAFPLEALVFYRWPSVRLGGGISYHLAPGLDVSGAGGSFATDTDYKNSLGFVLQADYRVTEKLNIGLRFTSIDYDEKNSSASFDGNSLGIVFGGSF